MKGITTARQVDDYIRATNSPFTIRDIWQSLDSSDARSYLSVQSKIWYLYKKGCVERVSKGLYRRIVDPPRPCTEPPKFSSHDSLTAVQIGESIIAKIQQLKQELSECKADLTRLVEDNRVLQERNTKLKETLNGYLKGTSLNLTTMEVSNAHNDRGN